MAAPIDEAAAELSRAAIAGAGQAVLYPLIYKLCEIVLREPATIHEKPPTVDRAARMPLLAYAWFSAEEAVRRNSPECVTNGLVALVVEGGAVDLRDDVMRLAVLFHSAGAISLDATRVFTAAARLSSNQSLADEIRTFPNRQPAARDLSAFAIRATGEFEAFAYKFEGASYKPKKRGLGSTKPVIPSTRATAVGYDFLLLTLPLIGYKVFHRVTGQPINHQSLTVVVLAGIFLVGFVVGLGILGVETIRSAFRDSDDK